MQAKGLNLVGLKRAGYEASDMSILKQAYRILYRSGLKLDDALAKIESRDAHARNAAPGQLHPAQRTRHLPRMSASKT